MGTAGRTAPLRSTGSLLGLLGLEVAAVLGLHGLGRFAGLRIGWDEPVPWLLNSPIQNVLGSILRMVALVMAYWLLASTVAYLLASLTRLPGAVRAVGWATLPLVRRVADHAVAVTLATSMVGGSTLGVAGPALAADGLGPPAPKPAAAAGAAGPTALAAGAGAQDGPTTTEPEPTRTSEPAYTPDPADQVPTTTTEASPSPPTTEPEATRAPATTEPEPTRTSKPAYTPDPADQIPTTTTRAPGATEPPTTEAPTTTASPATNEPPTTAAPTTQPPTTAAPTTEAPADSTRRGAAAPAPSTTGLRDPSYQPTPAPTTPPPRQSEPPPDEPGPGGGKPPADQETSHTVAGGENLWTIARDHLEEAADGGSEAPTNDQVTAYWAQVKEANQGRLESDDPDVIRTGEKVVLPEITAASEERAPETRKQTSQPAARGDSLWTIARDHLAAVGKGSGEPSNRQVAEYWAKVKEANRHRLASGDPDLIEPGESIVLPPVD
jgi:hypothetical protein